MTKGKCLIVAGGEYSPFSRDSYEYVIACDKGYEYCNMSKITPDIVLGDFDSVKVSPDPSLKIITLPKIKDDTDTVYAVKYALKQGFSDITVHCAFGGRLDHTFANIQTAAYIIENGGTPHFTGTGTELYMIRNSSMLIKRRPDSYLSVFSYSEMCTGVTLKGLKYELTDAVISNAFPLGVSNEWFDDEAFIEIKNGTACIIISSK